MRSISKVIDKSLDQPLGRYQLIALLGQGGMADVYLACTQGPGGFQKLLVVKLARFTGDPMLSRMFLDEARLAAQLSHPNVVQTFEVGEEGSRHFMVMEYLDGATLGRLRQRAHPSGGVPLRLAVQILSQVLEGLEYAHQARGIDGKLLKVVHRDLTPSNIVITVQGVTKILDFGIAKAADSYSFTQAGRYSGKLAYMPPEQLRAERVDERADIFSVGVILAEAALGMRFWGSATEPMVAARLISGDLPSFDTFPHLDPELRLICERALSPDREHRYPSATAFKDDLLRFLQQLGGPAPREELAEFVCSMVGEDRAKLQAIVDHQLKQASQLPLGSEPAFPELPRIEATPPLRSAAHSAQPVLEREVSQPEFEDSVDVQVVVDSPTDHSTATPAPLTGPLTAPRQKRVATFAAIGGGLAVALALGIGFLGGEAPTPAAQLPPIAQLPPSAQPTTGGEPVAPSSPTPPGESTPTPAPVPVPVRLEIVVNPPTAMILLDGRSVGSNPYVGTYPRDSQIHDLVVTAPGYQEIHQRFMLDRDMMLQLQMQKVPRKNEDAWPPPARRRRAAAAAAARRATHRRKMAPRPR